jgi:hypothetical protein
VRDEALIDLYNLVRSMAAEASGPVPSYCEGDDRSPVQAAGVTVDGLNLDLPVDASDAAELLTDDRRLEPPLGREAGVLPVAATAGAGPRVRTRRGYPVGRRLQNFERVGPGKPGRGLGDGRSDPFTRQRVADEHHPARIILPGNTPTAVDDLTYGEF